MNKMFAELIDHTVEIYVIDMLVVGAGPVDKGYMSAEDHRLGLGNVGEVLLEPLPLLVRIAEDVVGSIGRAVVYNVSHAHDMHVSAIEGEIDRAEHFFELALCPEVQGSALAVYGEGLGGIEVGIVMIAHGLEYRHVDLGTMGAHGGHSARHGFHERHYFPRFCLFGSSRR